MSIMMMVKTFSAVVFAETLPNPTEVRLVKVKYKAVEYVSAVVKMATEAFFLSAKSCSQPVKNT